VDLRIVFIKVCEEIDRCD